RLDDEERLAGGADGRVLLGRLALLGRRLRRRLLRGSRLRRGLLRGGPRRLLLLGLGDAPPLYPPAAQRTDVAPARRSERQPIELERRQRADRDAKRQPGYLRKSFDRERIRVVERRPERGGLARALRCADVEPARPSGEGVEHVTGVLGDRGAAVEQRVGPGGAGAAKDDPAEASRRPRGVERSRPERRLDDDDGIGEGGEGLVAP